MATIDQPTESGLRLAIFTWIAVLGTLAINSLSNFFPPGGLTVADIANGILGGVLITPANYAFAIWGLIYLGLIAYGLYQFRPSQRQDAHIQHVNGCLVIACFAQMIWIYLFTLQMFWLSVIAMLVILLALIKAYLRLNTKQLRVSRSRRWMAQKPFSLYLGWISVATIVNIASALYASGLTSGSVGWTITLILVSAVLGSLVVWQKQDATFAGVFIWAYVAIAVRHSDIPSIVITALLSSLLLTGLLFVKKRLAISG